VSRNPILGWRGRCGRRGTGHRRDVLAAHPGARLLVGCHHRDGPAHPRVPGPGELRLAGFTRVLYNARTGRRYPHRPAALPEDAKNSNGSRTPPRFTTADLNTALVHYNEVLNISRDDLGQLLHQAESAAYQRRFGDLKCGDIMSTELAHVQFGTPLAEAWQLPRERVVKALPVTDRVRRIVGIVTLADFLRHSGLEVREGIVKRLLGFLEPSGRVHSDKPEVVR
jgi:CBS domain-containing membrane protein